MARLEWHQSHGGFVAYLVDLDTGNTVARMLLREPGCIMAAVNETGEQTTVETEEAADAWIRDRLSSPPATKTKGGG